MLATTVTLQNSPVGFDGICWVVDVRVLFSDSQRPVLPAVATVGHMTTQFLKSPHPQATVEVRRV